MVLFLEVPRHLDVSGNIISPTLSQMGCSFGRIYSLRDPNVVVSGLQRHLHARPLLLKYFIASVGGQIDRI